MRVLNIVAKFVIKPTLQNGSFIVEKGQVKIFGADDPTASILLSKFPEMKSSFALSTEASSSKQDNGKRFLYTSQQGEWMELDEAIAQITCYLNVLDQQEFTVVSAFKDELLDATNNDKYKVYFWTMQKASFETLQES